MKTSKIITVFLIVWMVFKVSVWYVGTKVDGHKQGKVVISKQMDAKDMEINRLRSQLDKVNKERNFVCKDVNLAFMQNKIER